MFTWAISYHYAVTNMKLKQWCVFFGTHFIVQTFFLFSMKMLYIWQQDQDTKIGCHSECNHDVMPLAKIKDQSRRNKSDTEHRRQWWFLQRHHAVVLSGGSIACTSSLHLEPGFILRGVVILLQCVCVVKLQSQLDISLAPPCGGFIWLPWWFYLRAAHTPSAHLSSEAEIAIIHFVALWGCPYTTWKRMWKRCRIQ